MADIEETPLPGVGVRYSFGLTAGGRLSVVHHHSGRVELYLAHEQHADESTRLLELVDDEPRALAELLGTSQIVREIDRLQQSIAGLSIEWLSVPDTTAIEGRTIGDLEIRRRTGVSVVAILRQGTTLPSPGPDVAFAAGDTVVVVGQPGDIRRVDEMLR